MNDQYNSNIYKRKNDDDDILEIKKRKLNILDDISNNSTNFLKKYKISQNNYTTFININTKEKFNISNINKINNKNLNTNCIAIDLTKHYFWPLYFDIDCKYCKSNINHEFDSLQCLNIKKIIEDELKKLKKKIILDCEIYKRENSCGLHIYFHTNYSIIFPLYLYIAEKINLEFEKNNIKLFVDTDIIYFPLPFSTKSDENNKYKLIKSYSDKNFSYSINTIGFSCPYDFIEDYEDNNNSIVIGNFEIIEKNISFLKKETIDTKKNKYLIFNTEKIKEEETNIPDFIYYLQNGGYILTSSNYPFAYHFFKKPIKEIKEIDYNVLKNNQYFKIYEEINEYVKSITDYNNCFEILKFKNFGYSFYLLFIYTYILNIEMSENFKLDNACEFLKEILSINYSDNFKLKLLNTYLDNISNPIIYDELKLYFYNPLKFFEYILNNIKLHTLGIIREEQIFSLYLQENQILEKKNPKEFYTNFILNYMYLKFKQEWFYLYDYKIKRYVKIHSKHLDKFLKDFFKNNNITLSFDLSTNLKYDCEIEFYTFNFYSYFTNTKYGIFDIISGTYLEPTPFLHFTNERKKTPISNYNQNKDLNRFEMNKQLMFKQLFWKRIISNLYDKKNKYNLIFILIIKGLESLPTFKIGENIYKKILYKIFNIFSEYNYDTNFILSLILNLKSIYKFDDNQINKVYDILYIIEKDLSIKDILNNKLYINDIYKKYYENLNIESRYKPDLTNYNSIILYFISIIILIFFMIDDEKIFDEYVISDYDYKKTQIENFKYDDFIKNLLNEIFNIENDKEILDVLITLLPMFSWDTFAIIEFLNILTHLLQTKNKNKVFCILIGCAHGGKSTLTKILVNICGENDVYAAIQKIRSNNNQSNADSASQLIYNSSLYLVGETSHLDSAFVKSLTGGDPASVRGLYEKPELLTPLPLIICASNDLPILKVSESIKTRIYPFSIETKFIQDEFDDYYNNPLLSMILNVFPKKQINENNIAQGLINLVFGTHLNFRDKTLFTKKLNMNIQSKKLITNILKKNCILYRFIYDSNLEISKHKTYPFNEFITKLKQYDEECKIKPYEILNKLKDQLEVTIENNIIYGLGLKTSDKNINIMEYFIREDGSEIKLNKIKKLLKIHIPNINIEEIDRLIRITFNNNIKNEILYDYKLK